ncbi:Vasa, partial [Operophtera brumata]
IVERGRGRGRGGRGGGRSDRDDGGDKEVELDENGEPKKPPVTYVPPEPSNDESEIFNTNIQTGVNFDKFDNTPIKVVIVSPTRELTLQIYTEARKFAFGSVLKVCVAYGGTAVRHQGDNIARGCHILVATPGRLQDFVDRNRVSFGSIRFVFLNNYLFVAIGIVGGASSDVEQVFHEVSKYEKQTTLKKLVEENEAHPGVRGDEAQRGLHRGDAVGAADADDSGLSADLGKILKQADQPIPDFLQGGGTATYRGNKYGGSDIRSFNNATAAANPGVQEEEEEW